jgi:hypothetical protein
MEIAIVGGAYEGRSKNLNAQKCQNLFPIIDSEAGKTVAALMGTPGLKEWKDLGYVKEIRGMIRVHEYLYVVCGDKVFKVDKSKTATEITNTLLSETGAIWMAHNGLYVVIVDRLNGKGYYIETGTDTLLEITDPDFPQPTSLTYQDGFFLVTAANTGRIYKSKIKDPTSWNALDFTTAEAHPDYADVVKSVTSELWVLGIETTEILYNSGNADFPYDRIPGSTKGKGIGASESVGEVDGIMFFLSHDYGVYRTNGLQLQKVSTRQIDYQIQQLKQKESAIGYGYSQEGHSFYVLTFPNVQDNKTLVYDLTTGLWHTRASSASDNRHPVNCHSFFAGKNIVGHAYNGKLYEYDFDTYTDDGTLLRRVRRAKAVHQNRKNIFHSILEIEFEAGVGLDGAGQGSDPQAVLRWSDDGGKRWSNEHWAGIGKIGKYKNRARWKKLGVSRERIYEVVVTDPVKTVILAAELESSIGST